MPSPDNCRCPIALQRQLAVEGLGTRIELQSDTPGTPPEAEVTAVALNAEDPIELRGQATAQAGISGDWLVWVKCEDSPSRPQSEEIALGRCSQIQSVVARRWRSFA